jgi:hypothetical protein
MIQIDPTQIAGRVRLWSKHNGLWQPLSVFRPNQIQYDWATIASKLLADGDTAYQVTGMYLEYENVASAGDPVSIPSFDRGEGVDYYNGLSNSSDRDYLRVPVIATKIDSTDQTKFPQGNQMTFFAQSEGTQGVHGKPFDAANNSTLFGGVLVAKPDPKDASQDLVFARFYFPQSEQQVKLASSQLGVEWSIELQ